MNNIERSSDNSSSGGNKNQHRFTWRTGDKQFLGEMLSKLNHETLTNTNKYVHCNEKEESQVCG